MSHALLEAASRAHGQGRFDQAEGLFRSIDAGSPEFPNAVMGMAVIAYQTGRFPDAVVHFSKLVAIRPGQPANHGNLGECLREAGRLDEALIQLNHAIALDPNQPDVLNSLGLIHHAQTRLDQAEQMLRRALQLRPRFPTALINLGMVLQERRRLKEAAESFRQALVLDPDNPMGNSNLGQILVEIGRIDDLEEAERCCLKAVRLTPDRPQPINNLGNVYRSMGRFEEALDCYRRAMTIAPQLAMPLNNVGQALQGRARHDEARDFYEKALALEPNSSRFHANYASLLNELEQFDDAIERYRHALSLDPRHAESHFGIGQVCMQQQNLTQAEACFRKAIAIDPELTAPYMALASLYSELGEFDKAEAETAIALEAHPKMVEAYYQIATRRKGKVSDPELEVMTSLLNEKYLGEGARSQLNFALGAVHDKRRDYESAGRHFQTANEHQRAARLKRSETYDPAVFTEWSNRMIAGFSPELIALMRGMGHVSKSPIFVVGLPRSGTTLTEQILASHPAIQGAGELKYLSESFEKLPSNLGLTGVDSFTALGSLNPMALIASAEHYLKMAREHAGDAPFIVDKMPDNLNVLGWIHLVFPNARIIHCRRDLRDIALSCWQTCFGAIRWANDWHDIARRFIDSQRLVEHWKSLKSIGCLDFPYESVIEDTESYARALINYIGLDWDPNCLRFHETRRPVRTASQSQVREPIYKTSVAKWRNYAAEMAPFVEEMERSGHSFD